MRVIAGRFRGRLLQAPAGRTTRPITDRVKETLFNILGHRFGLPGALPEFDVLDVFAGTGGLGIEALSRGARAATFVERDRRALKSLRENLDALGLARVTKVLVGNAWSMRSPEHAEGFGVIFADPPYAETEDALRVVDLLERLSLRLAPGGVVVYRHEFGRELDVGHLRTLRVVDERALGRMRLVLLETSVVDEGPHEPPAR